MITDKITNIRRYEGIDENIIKALKAIKEYSEKKELQDGTYEIVNDEIILHVITKETHKRSEAKMEIHKNFMDIHYMIKGQERCFVSALPSEESIDYNPETDNGFWECEDTGSISIGEGEFYAVWPLEPHCPLCNVGEDSEMIRKFIVKVRVSR